MGQRNRLSEASLAPSRILGTQLYSRFSIYSEAHVLLVSHGTMASLLGRTDIRLLCRAAKSSLAHACLAEGARREDCHSSAASSPSWLKASERRRWNWFATHPQLP